MGAAVRPGASCRRGPVFHRTLARQGYSSHTVVDTLTQLGGAKGWHDLLETRRLGIVGRDARTWRFILESVRSMAIPAYAEVLGGAKTIYLRAEDIARLTDLLAARLAEHVAATGDSESALTLLDAMKERPDLCAKYLAIVPNGLRGTYSQATYAVLVGLAVIKAGPSPYRTEPVVTNEESIRLVREPDAVADEWTAWVQSEPAVCRPR